MLIDISARVSLRFRFPHLSALTAGRTGMYLDPGVVRALSPTGETLGYGYAEPTERGQRERWVLFADLRDDFVLAAAPLLDAVTWDMSAWQALVKNVWTPGSRYVWAFSDVYTPDSAGWERSIPSPLPLPPSPKEDGSTLRIGTSEIDSGGRLRQLGIVRGYVAAFKAGLSTYADPDPVPTGEYWFLNADYAPAGSLDAAITVVEPDDVLGRTPEEFAANVGRDWGPGCAFAITGCLTVTGGDGPPEGY